MRHLRYSDSGSIERCVSREKLSIAHRTEGFRPQATKRAARLTLVTPAATA